MELQFQKSKQRLYVLDNAYNVIADYECRDLFYPGYNSAGQPYESLPLGTYSNVTGEITNGKYGPSYGTFYITTGDPRGRDIHGGGNGSSIADPYAPRQGWLGTQGCLRMQNEDGEAVVRLMNEDNSSWTLTVVE